MSPESVGEVNVNTDPKVELVHVHVCAICGHASRRQTWMERRVVRQKSVKLGKKSAPQSGHFVRETRRLTQPKEHTGARKAPWLTPHVPTAFLVVNEEAL